MRKFLLTASLLFLFSIVPTAALAQWPAKLVIPATRDPKSIVPVEAKLDSKLMAKEMPYRVVLPLSYETEKTKRFPVVYLLHGLTGNYRNWTDMTLLTLAARDFDFILVTPEGANGWYTDSAGVKTDQYESYIVRELIPEIDAKFRTLAKRDSRAIAGLSMGGYGAIKFGLKYPELFKIAGSFSGALSAAEMSSSTRRGEIGKSIDILFGPLGSDTRKANDIFQIVRDITPE
ncbi:MAG: alpha/beta hydrolase family protein, partial [Pyrinomonadaceae bacterium]|nr:alpha/beta hydrolase family protein [Pyrinomonadaceae bacterium]